jgi:hypothetical protein
MRKPDYETVIFTIEPDSDHMSSIYVKSDQTLYLTSFVKKGESVWFHILTPSNINLGFYENGQYTNGTPTKDACQGFTEGRTVFSPSAYGWGEDRRCIQYLHPLLNLIIYFGNFGGRLSM